MPSFLLLILHRYSVPSASITAVASPYTPDRHLPLPGTRACIFRTGTTVTDIPITGTRTAASRSKATYLRKRAKVRNERAGVHGAVVLRACGV